MNVIDINKLDNYYIFIILLIFIVLNTAGIELNVSIIVLSIISYILYLSNKEKLFNNKRLSSNKGLYNSNIIQKPKSNIIPLYGNIIPSENSLDNTNNVLSTSIKEYVDKINYYRKYNTPIVDDILKGINNMYLVLSRLDNSKTYKANIINLSHVIQTDIIDNLKSLELSIPVAEIDDLNDLVYNIDEVTINDIKLSKKKNKNTTVDMSSGIVYIDNVKPFNL